VCGLLCGHRFSALLGKYQRVWFLDYMVGFRRSYHLSPVIPVLFDIQPAVRAPGGSHPHKHLVQSALWSLVIRVGVSLVPDDMKWNTFSCVFRYLYLFFARIYTKNFFVCLLRFFGLFFNHFVCFLVEF
jgi:hypothetical protein